MSLPRTDSVSAVPGARRRVDVAHGDRAADRRPEAAGGDDADAAPSRKISVPSRAGALPSGLMPTRRGRAVAEFGEDALGAGKSAASRRRFDTAKPRSASTGEVVSSRSWP
jgi:hypothetical protein